MLQKGEKLEQLGERVAVITDSIHTFGHDALLLAFFARPKPGYRVCDFGTGCGIIPLYWCISSHGFQVDAVEIQPGAADMAARSVHACGLEQTIHVLCGDYLEPSLLRQASYDLIVCNPPYHKAGTGAVSGDAALQTARHEGHATFSAICTRAAELLKNGGRFCFCQKPERLTECVVWLRRSGLEPKRLCMVQQREGERPWLFLMEAKHSARAGLCVEPVFLVEQNGGFSPEMRRVYERGRQRAADASGEPPRKGW